MGLLVPLRPPHPPLGGAMARFKPGHGQVLARLFARRLSCLVAKLT